MSEKRKKLRPFSIVKLITESWWLEFPGSFSGGLWPNRAPFGRPRDNWKPALLNLSRVTQKRAKRSAARSDLELACSAAERRNSCFFGQKGLG